MSALARPAMLASLLAAAGLFLHPALRAQTWLPAHPLVVAALLLACATGLVARAWAASAAQRPPAAALALGFVLAVFGLALDGVRGQHGTLDLRVGQARNQFEELGPDGRSLGLRPLFFSLGVERVTAAGVVQLGVAGRASALEVTSDRSAAFGGYRFARPRVRTTGGVARLRVSVTDGTRMELADVRPGEPVQALGVSLALDEYFPDFALDDRQQPFTRSLELRNPAALLTVERGGQSYRAFVIQSLPGVHRVEPLGLTFSLLDVEPEQQVGLDVHHSPSFALVALFTGGALLLAGVLLFAIAALRHPAPAAPAPGDPAPVDPALPAGAVYVLALLAADGARLVSWSFGVPTPAGRSPLPGVGVFLALSLLASAAGTLWLGAVALAGQGERSVGRGALWLGSSIGAAGLLLAGVRVAVLPETTVAIVAPIAGIAIALALLLAALRGWPSWLLPAAVAAAVAAALATAALALVQAGTCATPPAIAAGATVLLGLSALVPAAVEMPRRAVFLLALVGLLVAAA